MTTDDKLPETASVALVDGQVLEKLPENLYIPPDALEVFLETFEGPLDLLLYLIRHQGLDILNIPIAVVTKQYMEYIELMREMRFELAAEYLLMAAMLAEIKSRMLLPQRVRDEEDVEDPRAELVRRLQEYERYKQAAEDLDALPRMGRDSFDATVKVEKLDSERQYAPVSFEELMHAFSEVLLRLDRQSHHLIQREPLSIRERMATILGELKGDQFVSFTEFFSLEEGRMGLVVTFIAILELLKQTMIELVQAKPYSPIHIRAVSE